MIIHIFPGSAEPVAGQRKKGAIDASADPTTTASSEDMTSLHDLSIDAADTGRGLEIFRREGVVIAKGLLPVGLAERTADFLRAELARLDGLGIAKDDAAAPAQLTALMQRPADQVPDRDNHIFLGHFPLEVRLADQLRDIPRFVNRHPSSSSFWPPNGCSPTCRRRRGS
ncbi:hypothetical protein [Reyranella sp.]|uniref:hypothetical protein n=1 Tax=Reyranella sp. TaxID=1929291 RepID=UPI003D1298C8